MTSKKYMIQPVSLPPPSRHSQNGSRTVSLLAKNSKSLHALGPSDIKRREKETTPGALPGCSILSSSPSYDHSHLNCRHLHRRTSDVDQPLPPPELETDLKKYRDYLDNERTKATISSTQVFVHPFQYIGTTKNGNNDNNTTTTNGENNNNARETETENDIDEMYLTTPTPRDDQKKQDMPTPTGDFSSWIKEMNSKIHHKKRQIRSEKKRVEREKQTTITPTSPTSSPSLPKKQKSTLFQLRKKKTKKENYDNITPTHLPKRSHTMEPTKQPVDETIKLKKIYSQQFPLTNTPGNSSQTNNNNNKKTNRNPSQTDLRLFQIVRTRTASDVEEDTSSSISISPRNNSPRNNITSRSPVSSFSEPFSSSSTSLSPASSSSSKSSSPTSSSSKSSPFSLNLSFIKTSPRSRVTEFSSCSSEEKGRKKTPRNVVAAT